MNYWQYIEDELFRDEAGLKICLNTLVLVCDQIIPAVKYETNFKKFLYSEINICFWVKNKTLYVDVDEKNCSNPIMSDVL